MFDFFKNLLNSKSSDAEYNLDNISEDELNFVDDEVIAARAEPNLDCLAKNCKINFNI